MNICVYGASSSLLDENYTKAAYAVGKHIGRRGHGLVFGGGDKGLMGAAARGATEANGVIIGVSPSFFNVDGVLYEHCTQLIMTDTMRERKQKMEDISDAFVMLPGGIGTFEEFFEIFTAKQLGIHAKAIAVLNTNGYYDEMIAMLEKAVREHFMNEESMKLFDIFDDLEAIVPYFEAYRPQELKFHKY